MLIHRQTIQAAGDNTLNRVGEVQLRQIAHTRLKFAHAIHNPDALRIEQGPHNFFTKEWVVVGTRFDEINQRLWKRCYAQLVAHQRAYITRIQRLQWNPLRAGIVAQTLEFDLHVVTRNRLHRTRSHDQHYRGDAGTDCIQQLPRGRVQPMRVFNHNDPPAPIGMHIRDHDAIEQAYNDITGVIGPHITQHGPGQIVIIHAYRQQRA